MIKQEAYRPQCSPENHLIKKLQEYISYDQHKQKLPLTNRFLSEERT